MDEGTQGPGKGEAGSNAAAEPRGMSVPCEPQAQPKQPRPSHRRRLPFPNAPKVSRVQGNPGTPSRKDPIEGADLRLQFLEGRR